MQFLLKNQQVLIFYLAKM